MTLKMTPGDIANDIMELAILKNPNTDTEVMSLVLTLPRTQVNASDSSYKPLSRLFPLLDDNILF